MFQKRLEVISAIGISIAMLLGAMAGLSIDYARPTVCLILGLLWFYSVGSSMLVLTLSNSVVMRWPRFSALTSVGFSLLFQILVSWVVLGLYFVRLRESGYDLPSDLVTERLIRNALVIQQVLLGIAVLAINWRRDFKEKYLALALLIFFLVLVIPNYKA